MAIWYAYKRHFTLKNNIITCILPSWLKVSSEKHSSKLSETEKKEVKKGDTFLVLEQHISYYIVQLPEELNENKSKNLNITRNNIIPKENNIIQKSNENNIIQKPKENSKNKKSTSTVSNKKIYISIGWRCDSAVRRGNHYKLLSPQYKTCPFDLMISNLEGIVKCFEDDFQEFCNPEYLKYDGKGYIKNTYYHFMFNHETPGHADLHLKEQWPGNDKYHFTKNNFKNFIERYNRRISNLRNYINENDHIIFIIQMVHLNQNNHYLIKLKNLLKKKYPGKQFSFDIFHEPKKDFFTNHMSIAGVSKENIKLLL